MSNWFKKKEDPSQALGYSSSLPTVNAIPVYDVPAAPAVALPPPPTVPPPPPKTSTPPSPIVVHTNTDFFLLLGRKPTIMRQCPKCSVTNTRTLVKTYPSVTSWLMTIGMLFICFSYRYMPIWFVPIAFLPLVYEKLKKSDHYCVHCGKRVGSVAPLSDCGVIHLS
ncbi:hypothetical protein ACHAW6_009320 [Cyclotella cf. meneghiniana]